MTEAFEPRAIRVRKSESNRISGEPVSIVLMVEVECVSLKLEGEKADGLNSFSFEFGWVCQESDHSHACRFVAVWMVPFRFGDGMSRDSAEAKKAEKNYAWPSLPSKKMS